MAYLHSWKLVHGNVKPENMLLDRNFNLKITDFGTSNVEISTHEELTSDSSSASETISYMAPEVIWSKFSILNTTLNLYYLVYLIIVMQVIDSKPYDRKCDVYSFGICLWEIYSCCDIHYPNLGFSELSLAILYQVQILNFLVFIFGNWCLRSLSNKLCKIILDCRTWDPKYPNTVQKL